ncbi:MAG: hypothetical protein R3350_06705, partial [Saprospiraceae bacterium]|nr:hypothetical protein [Saprospiraceae bacterium]
MEMELRGLLAKLQGNSEKAEAWFEKATLLEESISYAYGPPSIVKPSHELYGEWLLEQKRWKEAAAMFEQALDRGPKRLASLRGLKKAAEGQGDAAKAREIEKILDEVLDKGTLSSRRF